MKEHTTLKTAGPTATDAIILDKAASLPTAVLQRASEATIPVHFAPQAEAVATALWRGAEIQPYDSAIRCAWRHGGLNDREHV